MQPVQAHGPADDVRLSRRPYRRGRHEEVVLLPNSSERRDNCLVEDFCRMGGIDRRYGEVDLRIVELQFLNPEVLH